MQYEAAVMQQLRVERGECMAAGAAAAATARMERRCTAHCWRWGIGDDRAEPALSEACRLHLGDADGDRDEALGVEFGEARPGERQEHAGGLGHLGALIGVGSSGTHRGGISSRCRRRAYASGGSVRLLLLLRQRPALEASRRRMRER